MRFWLHLGAQVGAMLATFSAKNGGSVACSRPFCFDGVFSPLFGPPGHLLGPIWGPFWQVFAFILAQFWRASWPFLGSFSKPGAHTNPKLLGESLCRRPSACRTHGGGNAACRAKDPPRQAVGLRMACRIPYPNLLISESYPFLISLHTDII